MGKIANEYTLKVPQASTKQTINQEETMFMELVKVKLTKISETTVDKMKPQEMKKTLEELIQFCAYYRIFNLDFDLYSRKALKIGSYSYSALYGLEKDNGYEGFMKVLNSIVDIYSMTDEEALNYCKEVFT